MKVVTRFAPSPTGYLHVGGARTALFSFLYAKHHGGEFILRIEDTDRERSTDESIQAILDGMTWLGLQHDQGPFYQTKRMARYQEVIESLLESGNAYKCYCSKERLEALREDQIKHKLKPRYDGRCRDSDAPGDSEPYVIRFKTPKEGVVSFDDLIRGRSSVSNNELDDLIIARSDGTPTYNLTVVVDDWDMGVTHVIRGDDHINNTPRQINILKALGAELPHYAHVPMILGEDGKRLSKRHGAVSVLQYKEDGYLPEALLNYLVRLGWSHGDQEIFSMEELVKFFDLSHINNSPAAFNHEKLQWLNHHYLKLLPTKELAVLVKARFAELNINIQADERLDSLVDLQKERAQTVNELVDMSMYFYQDFDSFDEKAAKKHLRPVVKAPLEALHGDFADLDNWAPSALHDVVHNVAERLGLGMGKVGQPLRVAVTGNSMSPSIDMTLFLIGKEKVLERIQKALGYIQSREQE